MNVDLEIRRLLDVLPASGRMAVRMVSVPQLQQVLNYRRPRLPWGDLPVEINFNLWEQLPRPQRDLLILRTVSWRQSSGWVKLEPYQGLVLAGLLGMGVELWQGDVVGILAGGGVSLLAGVGIWRSNQGLRQDIAADREAVRVAQRRGYSESEAAQHLLAALQSVADLEKRALNFNELIRSQSLRVQAGLSATSVPETLR